MDSYDKERNELIQLVKSLPHNWLHELKQFIEFLRYRANLSTPPSAAPELTDSEPIAYQRLQQSGFIGCGEADPDLSQTYKAQLSDSLNAKYDHR